MENWLICLGIWGEADLFLGIWGAKANTFRETRTLFAGRRGDRCIIFKDQGSTDPLEASIMAKISTTGHRLVHDSQILVP